jgi:hypothetical protein
VISSSNQESNSPLLKSYQVNSSCDTIFSLHIENGRQNETALTLVGFLIGRSHLMFLIVSACVAS